MVITTLTTRWSEAVSDPLFDSYLMVDWSAANVPRRGRDSIWLYHLQRRGDGLLEVKRCNPATRRDAERQLRAILRDAVAARRSLLLGCDFSFGYARGFAEQLRLAGPPWRAVWNEIAGRLEDDERNRNNRFDVAIELNRRVSSRAFPFWGCPRAKACEHLETTHHRHHCAGSLCERRIVEQGGRVKGPQPIWKLLGTGSVGSQALTGIPVLCRLRDDPEISGLAAVWPFETGLKPLVRGEHGRIIFAEIYPSLIKYVETAHEVKDETQMRCIARYFAERDLVGELAPLFAGDRALTHAERRAVEAEEGWILGVTRQEPSPLHRSLDRSVLSRKLARDVPPVPLAGAGWNEGR
jgi:precorrin-8X/cobalt-precorrin-8 methylmutase